MRNLNENSVAVYHLIVKKGLTDREYRVLTGYEDGLHHTDLEIGEIVNLRINSVTGRVGSLIEQGMIVVATHRPSPFSNIASRACQITPKGRAALKALQNKSLF